MKAIQEHAARIESAQRHLNDLDQKQNELDQEEKKARLAYESSKWDMYVIRHHPLTIQEYASDVLAVVYPAMVVPPLLKIISEYVIAANDRERVFTVPRQPVTREFSHSVTGEIMGFGFYGYVKNYTLGYWDRPHVSCYISCQLIMWTPRWRDLPKNLCIRWKCTVTNDLLVAGTVRREHIYNSRDPPALASVELAPVQTVEFLVQPKNRITFDSMKLEFFFELDE